MEYNKYDYEYAIFEDCRVNAELEYRQDIENEDMTIFNDQSYEEEAEYYHWLSRLEKRDAIIDSLNIEEISNIANTLESDTAVKYLVNILEKLTQVS